jgi:hypothetical protein
MAASILVNLHKKALERLDMNTNKKDQKGRKCLLRSNSTRHSFPDPGILVNLHKKALERLDTNTNKKDQKGRKMLIKFKQYETFISGPCIREPKFQAKGAFCLPVIKATIHREILLIHTST